MTDALPGSPVEPGDKQFQRRMKKGHDNGWTVFGGEYWN